MSQAVYAHHYVTVQSVAHPGIFGGSYCKSVCSYSSVKQKIKQQSPLMLSGDQQFQIQLLFNFRLAQHSRSVPTARLNIYNNNVGNASWLSTSSPAQHLWTDLDV